MGEKIRSILLSLIIILNCVLPNALIQVQAAENSIVTATMSENIAKGKDAIASDYETEDLGPDQAFDGIINRDAIGGAQSRWASNTANGEKWIQVDLGGTKTFDAIVLEWERRNTTHYIIQTSNDETTWVNVYTSTVAPINFREEITLKTPAQGRYVRLLIKSYLANSEGVVWNTVSLFEMELYKDGLPEREIDLDEVVECLSVQEVGPEDTQITMPVVPEGFEIDFIGADYEQVIGRDLTIHKPIVTTKVLVNFRVKKGDQQKESNAIEVTVPGRNTTVGENNKPRVIPEIREWFGKSGKFKVSDSSKVIVDSAYENDLMEIARIFANDYKEIVGKDISIVVGANPQRSDFYFTLNSDDRGLGKEGYYIDIDSYITVKAVHKTGVFWSTRTLLQILKYTEGTLPKGLIRDYPRFEVRGFMLDVGRKFISIDYLYEFMKTMSWYKLNDFQIHLNDNYIWLEDYGNDAINAYAGWRLESSIEGLESKDGSYSKKEFGEFIDNSRDYGVHIVPEIDTPAHALALTKVRPDLKVGPNGKEVDHLDIRKPETLEFVKDVFDEYIDDNTFRNATIHIGTDEFDVAYKEQFRNYTDKLIRHIRDDKNKTPRIWGSLTARPGTTLVTAEGVEMNIWNLGWAEPRAMYKQGYKLINTDDAELYIVPGANYYKDYLNAQSLYNNWTPEKFSSGVVIPAGSDQMLGGMFALWNDMIDKRANGITQYDIFDRVIAAIPTLSEKMWGKGEDKTFAELTEVSTKIGLAPNTNPKYEVESQTENILTYDFEEENILDKSGNNYNSVSSQNIELVLGKKGKGLLLKGGSSFVETPVKNVGPTNTLKMWVKKTPGAEDEEQILLESKEGVLKAVQKETGKVGFSREGYDYSFDYTLPDNEWVELGIVGYKNKTELYINNEKVGEISRLSSEGHFATFILPLWRIGSTTNSFKGVVDNVSVYNSMEIKHHTLIPQSSMSISATSEHPNVGKEGLATFAIDGELNTIWHTNYNNKVELPHSITLNLNKEYIINKFTYLPRQGGGKNGTITQYELAVSTDGNDFATVSEGTWADDTKLKVIEFYQAEASYVRLTAKTGVGGFASAAELNVHKVVGVDKTVLEHALEQAQNKYDLAIVGEEEGQYPQEAKTTLAKEIAKANAVKDNDASPQEEDDAVEALNRAIKIFDDSVITKGRYTLKLTGKDGVQQKEEFAMTIGIDKMVKSVYSQDITLEYDPVVFTFDGIKETKPNQMIPNEHGIEHNEKLGLIRVLGVVLDGKGLTGSADLFSFNFIVNETQIGTSSIISAKAKVATVEDGISTVVDLGMAQKAISITGSEDPKEPEIGDNTKLKAIINNAIKIAESATIGIMPGNYLQSAKDVLLTAIANAQEVMHQEATQDEITQELVNVNLAIRIFEESIIKEEDRGDIIEGDVNEDGKIDIADLAYMARYYHVRLGDAKWNSAKKVDVNGDGKIDMADIGLVAKKIIMRE